MKRIVSLTLALLLLLSALAGCAGGEEAKSLTVEERTELYVSAITGARSDEDNEYRNIWTVENEEGPMFLEVVGLTPELLDTYAVSASMMNVQAYGVAVVYPAQGKGEEVTAGLQSFIDRQKQNFEFYLEDQYDVAKAARLETLSDGTVVMVMCEGQDDVFSAIKSAIEG